MFRKYIQQLSEGRNLSRDDTSRAFQIILNGGATPAQIAAVLVALRMKGESVDEIAGAAITMHAKMDRVHAPEGVMDVCGTGGDAANRGPTLNISTAVALTVAACGVPVAKHGNKSVSSLSGSADVLATLGVNIKAEKSNIERSLAEAGIGFMFAPIYHRAMRHVTPTRQELGIRTIFNLVGPLVNPAMPKKQLLGVYDRKLLEPMAEVLRILGSEKALVVHGSDGMDELTITGKSYLTLLEDGQISSFEITPEDAGLHSSDPSELKGSNPDNNARELNLMLSGKHSAYRDIVLLNAAAALVVAGKVSHMRDGVGTAAAAIDSGKAVDTLASLIRISNTE